MAGHPIQTVSEDPFEKKSKEQEKEEDALSRYGRIYILER
jgi:hypothetical protein